MQQFVTNETVNPETVVKGKIVRKVKSYDNNIMVVEVDFRDGAEGSIHKHYQEQISYCINGEFDYIIEQKVFRMKKGDTIFVPKELSHGCKLISDSGTLLDIFTPARQDFIKEN